MSNKRIQKKRAKTEMLRDKSKLIAGMIALLDADKPRSEQLKIANKLWTMSLEELVVLSNKAISACVCYHSPLRPMMPGRDIPAVDWSSTVRYRPTIQIIH